MNAKHTPGPWRVGNRQPDDNTVKIGVPINRDDTILQAIAWVAPRPSYEEGQPQRANARLIAAAPDLLAALARFVGPCEHPSAFGPCEQKSAHWTIIPRDPPCRMCQTRAAIRKATGEGV